MSAPPEIPMPDAQTYLLSSRAYLLSLRDQNLPLRRSALEDAEAHFAAVAGNDLHETQLAVVAVVGEALQIVEDIAALANSFFASPDGVAFFATAASYSTRGVNNFYSSFRNRPLVDVLALLGMRFGDVRTEDLFVIAPPLTEAERAAIDEAHTATAKLVREHLLTLAHEWERYRRFFHAYKHGLLVVNPADGGIIDDRTTPVEGIVVWVRRRPDATGVGAIEPPYEETVAYVGEVGRVALDLIEHLVESRLRIFELIDLKADGSWTPRPLRTTPWLWWFRAGDVSPEARELLSRRFGTSFEPAAD
jgi:hypothetical protein